MLGEPTNDVDADMLAALEDLLDSWPGTLIVVSHDRYLLERVTDQQYAILDGRLRHLPGGVDEYLRLRRAQASAPSAKPTPASPAGSGSSLSGAERRTLQKELAAVERRIAKLGSDVAAVHERMAAHDHSDYAGLQRLMDQLRELEDETATLEDRWLDLSESLDS